MATTAPAQVGTGKVVHQVHTGSDTLKTIGCGRTARATLTEQQAAALGKTCGPCDRAAAKLTPAPAQEAPAPAGPQVHRFADSDTAYDACATDTVKDGDVLVIASEGIIGALANGHPLALTEAFGQLHPTPERTRLREMNGGRFAATGDAAEAAARELGLTLLPRHCAPAAPEFTPEPWAPGHCTPMMGGAVHEVTGGLDGSDGGPVHVFPLCRTGSMTNQGTRYRKVDAELTCRNCIGNRDRRHAAQAARAAVADAETALGSTPEHAAHPDVVAACEALDGLAAATLTDQHDVNHPKPEEQGVRGYFVEPREGGRVAVYWLEGGALVRRNQGADGAALDCLAASLQRRGWSTERMLRSSHCVFAHRPAGEERPAPAAAVQEMPAAPAAPAAADREGIVAEIGARLAAVLTWSNARAFEAVRQGDGARVGWTFRTRSGSIIRYQFVAARGLLLDNSPGFPARRAAEGALLDHVEADADAAPLLEPVARYVAEILAEKTHAELAELLHSFDVDAVKVAPEGRSGCRLVVTRGPDFLGTIFDAGPNARRGRYEAWAPYAGTKGGLVGFHATTEAAVAAIEEAWPVAVWEIAEDTGAAAEDVLAAAEDLDAQGGRVILRIAAAIGPDTKLTRAAARTLHEHFTAAAPDAAPAEETAPVAAEPLTVEQAKRLTAGVWSQAEDFKPLRDEGGRFLGYTFRCGALHNARYGWITLAATYSKALECYRSTAERVLVHADRDDQEAAVRAATARVGGAARHAARLVHPDAHNFRAFHRPGEQAPAGFTFRTGYGARARYGVVTPGAQVSGIGLYEYATTAERAFLQAEQAAPEGSEA